MKAEVDTIYRVKTGGYEGPLEKLLFLIQEKQLDITEVSLANVTGDFIDYVKSLEASIPHAVLADFLVIVARLVLIKSKILLPSLELTEEEELDIKDLESRLRIYKEYKRASQLLAEGWTKRMSLYGRQLFQNLSEARVFYPPPDLTVTDLEKTLRALMAVIEEYAAQPQTVRTKVITLEEKIEELLTRFKSAAGQSFRSLSENQSKEAVIILFLAVLHLFRHERFSLHQGEKFGDIMMHKLVEKTDS